MLAALSALICVHLRFEFGFFSVFNSCSIRGSLNSTFSLPLWLHLMPRWVFLCPLGEALRIHWSLRPGSLRCIPWSHE